MSATNGTAPAPDPSLALARATVGSLMRAGVVEFVVCAGARNAALVAVLAATPEARLWSFPEERCAGFFALGRSRAQDAPVAVVTTSGTAVAELLPAVIEAHYLGAPLVLVTADRPRAFRGTGAPQAIEQPGIFGPYVATSADIATVAELADMESRLAAHPFQRPFHLNLCFDEPTAAALAMAGLSDARPTNGDAVNDEAVNAATGKTPPSGPETKSSGIIGQVSAEAECANVAPCARDDGGTVEKFLADEEGGPLVAVVAALPEPERSSVGAFLRSLGCPVIAEATSGLRESPPLADQRVFASEAVLAALPVGRVLRIGGVPSSRWWRDLEHRPEVRVLSLTPTGFPGLARPSDVGGFPDWSVVRVPPLKNPVPAATAEPDHSSASRASHLLATHPHGEPSLIHTLSCHIPRGSLVFLGNSLPIREWNIFATHDDRQFRCHANRGANGIDGCVSTFLGLAAEEPECWAVIGDLTALYDLAALWITPALPQARRRIALINNAGGRIFSRVAALKGLAEAPRRIMENPHHLTFQAWAALFGWAYATATSPETIADAARRTEPHLILEITPDPTETEAVWAAMATATRSPSTDSQPPNHPA